MVGWWGVILVIGNEVTSGWEQVVGKANKDLTHCKSASMYLCVANFKDPPQLSIDSILKL